MEAREKKQLLLDSRYLRMTQIWAENSYCRRRQVGALLVKVSVGLLRSSVGELTESSLSGDIEKEIEDIICSFPDVSEPHNLRTRRIGNRFAIEAHVRMDGNLPLTAAHDRATAIEQQIRKRFGPQTHVTIHMEPVK